MICRMPQAPNWSRGDFRHEDAVVAGDRIYIGFQCKDRDPRHISIQTMRRDETMRRDGATKTDDTVRIILDTYGDPLTGYFFHAEI